MNSAERCRDPEAQLGAGKKPDMDAQGADLAAMCMDGNCSDRSGFGGHTVMFPSG